MSNSPTPSDDASRFSVQFEDNESLMATQETEEDGSAAALPSPPRDGPSAAVAVKKSPVESRPAPKVAAVQYLDRFASTLHWSHSSSACRELGAAFLQCFSTWYYKKVGLVGAKSDPNYSPRSCEASVSLQPCKRATGGTAFTALAAEAASVTKKMKVTLGQFAIRMDSINCDCMKEDIIDSVAKALPALADAVLIETGARTYGKHNLVADVLMLYHRELLRHHEPITSFIPRYKQVNQCGRDPEDATALYEARFNSTTAVLTAAASATDHNAISPSKLQNPSTSAIADAQKAPPPTTGKKSSPDDPTRALFAAAASTTKAIVAPSPSTIHAPSLDDIKSIDQAKEWYLKLLALGAKDSPSIAALLQQDQSLLEAARSGESLLKSTQVPIILPRSQSVATKTNSSEMKALSPPRVKWDPYNRRHYFTRDHTPQEIEELCRAVDTAERQVACQHEVLIDSIREENYVNPTRFAQITKDNLPPEGEPPLEFANLKNDLPMESVVELLGDSDLAEKLQLATKALWERVNAIFIQAPSVFINQYVYNNKHRELIAAESARRLSTSASETVAVLTSDTKADPKTTIDLINTAVQKATSSLKRKWQSKQDEVLQRLQKAESNWDKERRKREKAESMMQKLQAKVEAKGTRGPGEGASKINTPTLQTTTNANTPSVTQEVVDKASPASLETIRPPSLGGKKLKKQSEKKKVRIAVDDVEAEPKSGKHKKHWQRQKLNEHGRGRGRGRGRGGRRDP